MREKELPNWLHGFKGLTTNWQLLFMMQDFFEETLGKVCEMTELSAGKVLKSNKEECVDARYVVIALLSERMNGRQIAELSGWSTQLVSKAINGFHDRCKFRWGLKELYLSLHVT